MPEPPTELAPPPSLRRIAREWTRLGFIGFGGPPAHIVLLRELVVERERWIDGERFEDAIAASGLIPGPASTQLAIFCAGALGGRRGALIGAAGFILPGLAMVVALAAVLLAASPPLWIVGAGAGAGAAVPAVALFAGSQLLRDSLRRAAGRAARVRWLLWVACGLLGAALAGAWVVVMLLGCGAVELAVRERRRLRAPRGVAPSVVPGWLVVAAAGAAGSSALASVAWTAFKVGALSYGGGFVVIPLMRADAVDRLHWLTDPQFLTAVAVGQITPGPVTNTVAAVGWSAAGIPGAAVAAIFAFAPSILVVGFAGRHFERVRQSLQARAFLQGSGPAAIGAILGSAVPLAMGLGATWQWAVLGAAGVLLLSRRAALVPVLLVAALVGVGVAVAGGPLPR